MNSNLRISPLVIIIFIFIASFNVQSQSEQKILEAFGQYSNAPREIVYVHLNKSKYIKGEMLGFKAYVFNKDNKFLSTTTTNLYTTITDSNNIVVKKKLVKLDNGITNNIFKIDSSFTSGTYTFKAYTNWMLNFDEPNYFEQQFTVINPKKPDTEVTLNNNSYSIQVLPEGGHFLTNVKNSIGIIVKNNEGLGLGNAIGKIINQKNELISEFKLNDFGITKAIINPKEGDSYQFIVFNNDKEITHTIKDFDTKGINMSLNKLRDKVILTFRTNDKTSDFIKNKDYKLIVHNGSDLHSLVFNFKNDTEISKVINESDLFSGMNIFTVFDNNNRPILERLYFNYNGVKTATTTISDKIYKKDSISLKFKVDDTLAYNKLRNLSISVLPSETDSYDFTDNIISKIYLQPYIKGRIQNSRYYFSKKSNKTIFDLDLLLLSQGWSSYNWDTIFNNPPLIKNQFEKGISTVFNMNQKSNEGTYLMLGLEDSYPKVFSVSNEDKAFYETSLFPTEDSKYSIVKTNPKRSKSKLKLVPEFFPNSFPELKVPSSQTKIISKTERDTKLVLDIDLKPRLNSETVILDPVEIKAKKRKRRFEKLELSPSVKVYALEDRHKYDGMTLVNYINSNIIGFYAVQNDLTDFSVRSTRGVTFGEPQLYLNDSFLVDYSILSNVMMNEIDYIVVDRIGLSSMTSITRGGGIIKIYLGNGLRKKNNLEKKGNYTLKFPLTFSSNKQYYTPIYSSYTSDSFKKYGVIDWFPEVKSNEHGELVVSFAHHDLDSVNLYIEGVTDNNILITEVKKVSLNN